MSGRSIFHISKPTLRLILVMVVITIIGIIIAWIYYAGVNEAEDPRVVKAKHWYQEYAEVVRANDANGAMLLLDSIEATYRNYPDYRDSYELGVVLNNRCALLLNKILYAELSPAEKDEILNQARHYADSSIRIYESWINTYSSLSEEEIRERVKEYYSDAGLAVEPDLLERIEEKRHEDILLALKETPRRLSVAWSNRGVIARHEGKYELAINCYKQALEAWPENLNAENNINILLGQPVKERSFIERLFPKEKE